MASLEDIQSPHFWIIPPETPTYGDVFRTIGTFYAERMSEAMKAIVKDNADYRAGIESVGDGKYLRVREQQPSILDGEGEWNLPPSEASHVGEDTV